MPQSYFDPQLMESVASFGKMSMQMQHLKEQMDMNKLKLREGEANIVTHQSNLKNATQQMLNHQVDTMDKFVTYSKNNYSQEYLQTPEFQNTLDKLFPDIGPHVNAKSFKFDATGAPTTAEITDAQGNKHTMYSLTDKATGEKKWHQLTQKEESKTDLEKKAKAMGMTPKEFYEYESKQRVEEKRQEGLSTLTNQKKLAEFTSGLKPRQDKTELSADAKMKAIEKWDKSIANPNIKPETKKAMIKQRDALAEDVNLPPYEETEELSGSKKAVNWATEGLGLGTAFKPSTTGTSSSKIDKSKLRFIK